jgi:hypothetical protein
MWNHIKVDVETRRPATANDVALFVTSVQTIREGLALCFEPESSFFLPAMDLSPRRLLPIATVADALGEVGRDFLTGRWKDMHAHSANFHADALAIQVQLATAAELQVRRAALAGGVSKPELRVIEVRGMPHLGSIFEEIVRKIYEWLFNVLNTTAALLPEQNHARYHEACLHLASSSKSAYKQYAAGALVVGGSTLSDVFASLGARRVAVERRVQDDRRRPNQ